MENQANSQQRINTCKSLTAIKTTRISTDSMKKTNELMTKIKIFRLNYDQTLQREKASSLKQKLAQTIYTKGKNEATLLQINEQNQKNMNPESHKKYQSLITTELFATSYPVFSKLNKQTMNIPEYNKQILELNQEKQLLLNKIQELKRNIMVEHKISNKINLNASKYRSNQQSKSHSTIKNLAQRQRVIKNEINTLLKQNKQLEEQNNNINSKISAQRNQIEYLSNYSKKAKKGLIKLQKQLNELKMNLTAALKAMQHSSFQLIELENEKAQVLLFINSSVQQKKLK